MLCKYCTVLLQYTKPYCTTLRFSVLHSTLDSTILEVLHWTGLHFSIFKTFLYCARLYIIYYKVHRAVLYFTTQDYILLSTLYYTIYCTILDCINWRKIPPWLFWIFKTVMEPPAKNEPQPPSMFFWRSPANFGRGSKMATFSNNL